MQQINSVFKETLARITGNSYLYNKIYPFNIILFNFNQYIFYSTWLCFKWFNLQLNELKGQKFSSENLRADNHPRVDAHQENNAPQVNSAP